MEPDPMAIAAAYAECAIVGAAATADIIAAG